MSRLKREEKLAMVRLGVVLERLHAKASDPGTPEEEAIEAAAELGRTCLKHMDKIVSCLKNAFD